MFLTISRLSTQSPVVILGTHVIYGIEKDIYSFYAQRMCSMETACKNLLSVVSQIISAMLAFHCKLSGKTAARITYIYLYMCRDIYLSSMTMSEALSSVFGLGIVRLDKVLHLICGSVIKCVLVCKYTRWKGNSNTSDSVRYKRVFTRFSPYYCLIKSVPTSSSKRQ